MRHSIHHLIRRPVISEKSTALMEIAGRYVFEVDRRATKFEIKDAIQKLFNVRVQKVRTMNQHGKVKTVGRQFVKRANWKKAIVTLGEGQKIELFDTSQS